MSQLEFDFSDVTEITLEDRDGDRFTFDRYADRISAIRYFLKCTKTRAAQVLEDLEKEWDVYADGMYQIVLCKGKLIAYNFEIYGQTYWHGHKYNELGEWDFRRIVDGLKPKAEKKSRLKKIEVTCTEIQLKKARQLYYAHEIGFDVTYKDYQRWHLL